MEKPKEELASDELFLGAQSHLDPDLASSFLDDDVHDVRYTNAAHDERKGAHHTDEEAESRHEQISELIHLSGVPHQ